MSSRKIAPEYSFRFSAEDIRGAYGSATNAFDRGDFLNATQMAPADSELRGCGLILAGLLEQGLALLDGLDQISDRANLCKAFALWSLNRPADAEIELARIESADFGAAAEAFRSLIRCDDVIIFIPGAILSVFPEHYSQSFVAPVYAYGGITVKYVASQLPENAYDYDPADSFSEFVDALPDHERPDLIFSLSPQWLLPKDFHKVGVPKVIWCHDSDAFQYRNVDNYALYDVAICNCSQEHFELSQGTPGLYCAANLLLHPLATPFPEASPHREKHVDIIFTGSALAPFHSEKPRFLFKLAELAPRYKVQVIEGHMPEKQYFEVLSHAKFLPIVNRYAGSPSPRWRDALSNGACLLFPEGSFYDEIAPGCFSFRAETMTADIATHLDRCAAGGNPDYDFATIVPAVNERLAIHREPREASYLRLLKYALFMGLIWPHAAVAPAPRRQRRLVWLTPAVDCGLYGTDHIRDLIAHVCAHVGPDDLLDEVDYNNAAHLHAQAVFTFHESRYAKLWAARADHYFREGLARFPQSLLLSFNEAHWCFFKPNADLRDAEDKFLRIIERDMDLCFDPHGADVAFAYTLHGADEVFPCYEYADVATSELVLKHTPQLARKHVPYGTRDIILAACHGYVGWARLKSGRNESGLAWLKLGTERYPHGLPMLRLYFDMLLRLAAQVPTLPAGLASDLAEAFIAVANVNPSILLTHVYTIVPILAENGERPAAREVLAAWHRLANIVHKLRVDDEAHQRALFGLLWNHRSLLPKALLERIDEGLWDLQSVPDLTQLERRMIDVARISNAPEKRTRWWSARSDKARAADHVARLLAESGYEQRRVVPSSILRALRVWLGAPGEVRQVYLNKAVRMAMRGEFRQAIWRTQQWAASSKWSNGSNASAGRRTWRLSALRMWLMRLVTNPGREI
jgi:hypothetical protein